MRTGPQGSRRICMKRPLKCDSVLSHVHMGTQTPPAVVTDTRDLALLGLQLADGANAAPKGWSRQSSLRSLGEPCLLARFFLCSQHIRPLLRTRSDASAAVSGKSGRWQRCPCSARPCGWCYPLASPLQSRSRHRQAGDLGSRRFILAMQPQPEPRPGSVSLALSAHAHDAKQSHSASCLPPIDSSGKL